MDKETTILESDISFGCIVRMLLKNLWMILASGAVFAMLAVMYLNFLFVPKYTASMTYAVTAKVADYTASRNARAATQIAATLSELADTDYVREAMCEAVGVRNFDGEIRSEQIENSNFVNVCVVSASAKEAIIALNAFEEVFPSLSEYVSNDIITQVVRNPSISPVPSNQPHRVRIVVIAACLGVVLMGLGLVAWSILRQAIQTRDGARRLLAAPVLASIGHARRSACALPSRSAPPAPVWSMSAASMTATSSW